MTSCNAQRSLAVPDKPSIAVLAFHNMSGDPEQEYFSDGIADDIITELSRSHSLFVIARNSSFTYRGRAVDVKQVARELGVRYVLEGSVRRSGAQVRVGARLVDAETGNHIWAERYDREHPDIFAIQDEITAAVVAAIHPGGRGRGAKASAAQAAGEALVPGKPISAGYGIWQSSAVPIASEPTRFLNKPLAWTQRLRRV